ncbi:MAG: FtsX-like permease family protein [Bacteroidetes bacterium]|nr:FtsX-like permease family protein [Bacteroidota bacterium]
MWRNFIRVTLRSISKNKAFNAINIAGLAIGLASAIFIILYITSETSYDRFHERSADIYRLYLDGKMAGEEFKGAWNSPIFGPTFHEEIPDIENYCRIDFTNNRFMWVDPANKYLEGHLMYADSSFFEVFTIKLLAGDPATCLGEPNTILVSESKVAQYFPEGDPIGKSIAMNNDSTLFRVTGVVEDAPRTSHFFYDFIISYSTNPNSRNTGWFNNHMQTYILAAPGVDQQELDAKINASLIENIRPQLVEFMGVSPEEFFDSGAKYGVYTQALLKIHLESGIEIAGDIGYRPIGNRKYLVIFGIIAFFVLVIASINFMNLSTARSLSRAKEVSLRKVVGSGRRQLIRQFLFESVFLSLLSLIIAIFLVVVLLNPFNNLVGLSLELADIFRLYMFPSFILLAVLVGLLSGSYPSFVLASFKPIFALKGNASAKNGTTLLRNALVIIQFSISIIIIAGTLVIYWQFSYMTNKDLGFDKEQLVVMDRIYPLDQRIQTYKDELTSHTSILAATNSTAYLGAPNNNNAHAIKGRPPEEAVLFHTFWTDEDFMETYQFGLATPNSRFFSEEYSTDSASCLVNEAAVRKYNIEDPLNQYIINGMEDDVELRIVGVMKDYHFQTLKHEVGAQIVILKPRSWDWSGYLTVRLAPGRESIETGLKYMEDTWKNFCGDEPFQYFFLDEELDSYYAEEKRTGALTMIFSILAIFIASLGLFGLTLYNSQKRIREIGIRKVMGASEGNIITVISKSVGYAVGISILIAMPVAYFMMQDWLRDFPYNVGFQPLLFLAAALLAIIIAMVTVTITTLKAARINPAMALHYE